MNWKQFIVGLASNLAWPCVVAIFLLMFNDELSKIVNRIAHLKFKDLELEFEKVKQHAKDLHLERNQEDNITDNSTLLSLEDQIVDAVERAPSAEILLAWPGLETAISAAVSRLSISPDSPSYRPPRHNLDVLIKNGRLSNNYEKLINEIRILRNKLAHEQDAMLNIFQDQALNYADTAIKLIKHFPRY